MIETLVRSFGSSDKMNLNFDRECAPGLQRYVPVWIKRQSNLKCTLSIFVFGFA